MHIFLNFLLPVHIFMTAQYWQCNHSDDSEKSEIPSKNFVFKGADTDTTYTVKVANMINMAKTSLRDFCNMIIVIPRLPWFWMVGRSQLFKRNWKLCPKWNHRLEHCQHFSVCLLFVCICLFVCLCVCLCVCLSLGLPLGARREAQHAGLSIERAGSCGRGDVMIMIMVMITDN